MSDATPEPGAVFGVRLQWYRERAGKTRAVLGGLVGRSAEWVKATEKGRIGQPRLPMLIRLCDALNVDLADLTGDVRLERASYLKEAPGGLDVIRAALTNYTPRRPDVTPPSLEILTHRVDAAWRRWHTSVRERDGVAEVIPSLSADVAVAARVLDGEEGRRASALMARVYHLAQLYASHTPAPELVYLTSDRAMHAAQEADDPAAIAGATWYLSHVWRDAGEAAEARVELAADVADMLDPGASASERSLYALMHLAIALSHAKVGREGDAWRHHDEAARAAAALSGYVHPWLMIGQGMVDHYAVTMLLDLQQPGQAEAAAARIDPAAIPSRTRQSRYLVEVARAHHRQHEDVAAVHLLRKARAASADTFAYSLFARSMVTDMLHRPPAAVADDVHDLARGLHLIG